MKKFQRIMQILQKKKPRDLFNTALRSLVLQDSQFSTNESDINIKNIDSFFLKLDHLYS